MYERWGISCTYKFLTFCWCCIRIRIRIANVCQDSDPEHMDNLRRLLPMQKIYL
jgi:hypothetical protein